MSWKYEIAVTTPDEVVTETISLPDALMDLITAGRADLTYRGRPVNLGRPCVSLDTKTICFPMSTL